MTKRGRAREAEPLLREALAIGQKSSRRGDTAQIQGYLAECLTAQKRYTEVEPLLIDSYLMLKTSQVPASPALTEARERLASFYRPGQAIRFDPVGSKSKLSGSKADLQERLELRYSRMP